MKQSLQEILFEVDDEFIPSLSSQMNIVEYIDKIIKNAVIIPIYVMGRMEAFIAIYCNDYDSYIGYLTMIIVRKGYRSKGFGKLLVNSAIDLLKELKFKKLRLEVFKSNNKAYLLYKKLGFEVYKENSDSLYMEKRL